MEQTKTISPAMNPTILRTDSSHTSASDMYMHVMQQVTAFEEILDDDHELALLLTPFASDITLAVTEIGYQDPDLLFFYGELGGQPAQLIQNISQLNLLLVAAEKADAEQPPRRIGFVRETPEEKAEEKAEAEGGQAARAQADGTLTARAQAAGTQDDAGTY